MNQRDLEALWIRGELAGVEYRFGDCVRITVPPDAPATGRIVALLTVTPEPGYVIELPDGSSVNANQGNLERAL